MVDIVNQLGLDGEAIVGEAGQQPAQRLLDEDFSLARSLGVRGFPTIVILNKENKGLKVVGSRPLEAYVDGLRQMLNTEDVQPEQRPSLSDLLEKEKLLFSKEIEVMYDIEKADINAFVEKELAPNRYRVKELLGESYFTVRHSL